MREILFRGKRKGCGDWVYGFCTMREFSAIAIFVPNPKERIEYAEPFGVTYCVDPETVGQYTGLTDKNGVKIFEGDIVRYTERRFYGEDFHVAHVVKFEEGGFTAHNYFLNRWLRNWAGGSTQLEGIEVIGNIHDNPELLEGE